MGLLQTMGLQAGYNQQAKLVSDQQQANVELTQQQVAQAKMATAMQQQRMDYLNDPSAKADSFNVETASMTDLQKQSMKLTQEGMRFERAGLVQEAQGSFRAAEQLQTVTKDRAKNLLEQKGVTAEAAATAAGEAFTSHNEADYAKAEQAAVANGTNPDSIPKERNSADYMRWLIRQRSAARAEGDKVTFEQKEDDKREQRKITSDNHAVAHADIQAKNAQTALYQQEMLNLKKGDQVIRQKSLDLRARAAEEKNAKGTPQELNVSLPVIKGSGEALRSLDDILAMGMDVTVAAGYNIEDKTGMLKALESTAGRGMATEMQGMYASVSEGLGMEIANVSAAGAGGKKPNQSMLNAIQKGVVAHEGDSPLVTLFKTANAYEILKQVNKTVDPLDAKKYPGYAKTQAENNVMIDKMQLSTKDILKWAQQNGHMAELKELQHSRTTILGEIDHEKAKNAKGASTLDSMSPSDRALYEQYSK